MTHVRFGTMLHVAWLSLRIRAAERRERNALARAGESLAASVEGDTDAAQQLPAALRQHRRRLAAIAEAIPRSLEADRADYVCVSSGLRPLVILRGLCTRAILRNQRARCRRALRPFYEALGTDTSRPSQGEPSKRGPWAVQAEVVRAARAELNVALAERTRRLGAFDGAPLPTSMSRLAAETRLLAGALRKQLRDRLFPRLPALVGLAAGWWVANTYTDSHWKSALRSLGIGGGGTHVVSGETYRLMMFWLPILSAAICAYLGDRLAIFARQRYRPLAKPAAAVSESSAPVAGAPPVANG